MAGERRHENRNHEDGADFALNLWQFENANVLDLKLREYSERTRQVVPIYYEPLLWNTMFCNATLELRKRSKNGPKI